MRVTSPRTIVRVLVQEHRYRRMVLGRLADTSVQVSEADVERQALELAGHLMTEEAVVTPVVAGVLARDGHREARDRDIAFCLRLLARAGVHGADPPVFAAAVELAREAYDELTFRTEVEVLPYLHHAIPPSEQRRLAEIHPAVCRLATARCERLGSSRTPIWEDRALFQTVRQEVCDDLARLGAPTVGSADLLRAARMGAS